MALLDKGWRLEMDDLARRAVLSEDGRTPDDVRAAICQPRDLEGCQAWLRFHWSDSLIWSDENSHLQTIKRAYFDVVRSMNRAGEQFQIDDRKAVKLFKLVLARSMLHNGPDSLPTLSDVWAVLRHTWQDPDLAHLAMENVTRFITEVSHRYSSMRIEEGEPGQLPEALRFTSPERIIS
jgi:hypothetical protein